MRMLTGVFAAAIVIAVPVVAQQTTGQPARDFKLTDMNGKTVQLSQFKGKTVVLEWHNSGSMQKSQAVAVGQGAVWLTVNSGAPGKQGYMTLEQTRAFMGSSGSKASNYLLDPEGTVGKGYDAKTTPHMYVINPAGTLVYQGGIDDKPTADVADIATARNHVLAALGEVKAGKPISVAESRPYGCSVKYAS